MNIPKDYIATEERMKPRAERRRSPSGGLFCFVGGILLGTIIGAGLMAWYLL